MVMKFLSVPQAAQSPRILSLKLCLGSLRVAARFPLTHAMAQCVCAARCWGRAVADV